MIRLSVCFIAVVGGIALAGNGLMAPAQAARIMSEHELRSARGGALSGGCFVAGTQNCQTGGDCKSTGCGRNPNRRAFPPYLCPNGTKAIYSNPKNPTYPDAHKVGGVDGAGDDTDLAPIDCIFEFTCTGCGLLQNCNKGTKTATKFQQPIPTQPKAGVACDPKKVGTSVE